MMNSCGTKISQPKIPDNKTDNATAPVETEAPNADYPSAFDGQTRIAGVQTKTPYKFEILNTTLEKPWGIAVLPDGRLLITEKRGTMRIASASGNVGDRITGIPEVNSAGQGGL